MVAQSVNAQNCLVSIGGNYQQAEQAGTALWS
jgi:hypothetical protein